MVLENEAKGFLKGFLKDYQQTKRKDKSYSFVLELLLRMRQFSVSQVNSHLMQDHWSLCKERLTGLLELAKATKVDLTPENITLLQHMLDIALDAQDDCPVNPC